MPSQHTARNLPTFSHSSSISNSLYIIIFCLGKTTIVRLDSLQYSYTQKGGGSSTNIYINIVPSLNFCNFFIEIFEKKFAIAVSLLYHLKSVKQPFLSNSHFDMLPDFQVLEQKKTILGETAYNTKDH